MADDECIFLLALASARRRLYLLALSIASDSWVLDRGNTQQQLVVFLLSEPGFLAKNQLPTQAPEWITLPGIASWIRRNRRDCYVPLDSWSSTYGTLEESGCGCVCGWVCVVGVCVCGGVGWQSAYVHTLELQLQRYHEEPRKPMDRGDCQGSLHSSWSLVWPCDSAWGPSAFSFRGVQLSGGSTWHPVSSVLEVFRGVPEFVSAWHGLCCWGHVDTVSSGGCTTRSGSRTSSPTSMAYTICMQPLLRRS